MKKFFLVLVSLAALGAVGLGVLFYVGMEQAKVPIAEGYGPAPVLPEPNPTLLPTVNIATAESWVGDAKPIAAAGLKVEAFASGLDHPRWLLPLPNGDVLVAESNAPPKPEEKKSIKGWAMEVVMAKAGAGAE